MKPLVLITVWFGEMPDYFPFFCHSCRALPGIDFFVFHDGTARYSVPNNVRLKRLSKGEFQVRCESKLGFRTDIRGGYKLNDYKPLFGDLFEEEIEEYAYWGVCDIDQILARGLGTRLSQLLSRGEELITTHLQFLHGPLTIFENSEKMRRFYRLSRDWKEAITDPESRAFDECGNKYGGIRKLLGAPDDSTDVGKTFLELSPEELLKIQDFECLTTVAIREYQGGRLRLYTEPTSRELLRSGEWVQYAGGRIVDNEGRDWLVYHWVHEKTRRKFHYPNWDVVPSIYHVTQYGFFNSSTPVHNRFLTGLRFMNALARLIRDRVLHTVQWARYLCGVRERPGEFR